VACGSRRRGSAHGRQKECGCDRLGRGRWCVDRRRKVLCDQEMGENVRPRKRMACAARRGKEGRTWQRVKHAMQVGGGR
jgi:hypothetical protein